MGRQKVGGSRQLEPLAAFRFQVQIDDLLAGGFSECSGLELETEVFDYAEGGVNGFIHQLPTRVRQGVIVLKRGIVDAVIWDWYAASVPGKVELKSGSIIVPDENGDYWLSFRFANAWPRKVRGPELDAAQSQVAVETLELAHHGLTLVPSGQSGATGSLFN